MPSQKRGACACKDGVHAHALHLCMHRWGACACKDGVHVHAKMGCMCIQRWDARAYKDGVHVHALLHLRRSLPKQTHGSPG